MQIQHTVWEAASQIKDRLRHAAFYGGTDVEHMKQWLDTNPNMVIATPGRLRDMVSRRQVGHSSRGARVSYRLT